MNSILDTFTRNASSYRVRQLLSLFIRRRSNREHSDLLRVRRSATAPFTYCSKLVNELRKIMGNMRCLEQADNKGLFFILLPALLLLGIGRTMPWSLGIPLVDDNVKKKNLPTYFAGMSFIRVLGPITGFLIGSFCNKLYYTLHPPVGLTPSDPTWIGAWWIGFICIGVLTLFPSVSLFLFSAEVKSGSRSDGQNNQINLFDNYKDHQENQRSIYERMTAMFGVFGFAFGTIIGGFLTCQYRLNGRKAAMFVLVVSTINMCLFFSKTFIWCESVVNSVGLNSRNNNYNFTRECNSECGCTGSHLYPVCDAKGYAFFSPCHAGCHEVKVNREFSSCDCADGGVVRKNFCKDSCTFSTTIFFGTVLIGALFAGMGVVPGLLILLRSVPPETRSQSLGFQGLLVSLFGTLPSPILWGFVIDSSCLILDDVRKGSIHLNPLPIDGH
ncbi:sodium-independent organic anion transporter [Dictyocaulus viviparus]|uniref:Sodium-independent organic anion transporter n=1 Tax=Dictyocaulus viviparus TaxID=29172 RepID=A0A0D8XBG9_DICVI|nr:sodium-independent organic anion transporter [Dictyocaulus viviparus]